MLDDFGGSLRPSVRARLDEAVELAAAELARLGPARASCATQGEVVEPLNDRSLAIDDYETGRPSEDDACRIGDERLLVGGANRGER